eukprot:scaffold1404_cov166-Amphora_coffeaeformis.AAC.32
MSKRKSVERFAATSSKELNLYKKSYKGGGPKDIHLGVFREAQKIVQAKKVLYPGCHRHLTAALVFPDVTFVDYDEKVAGIFTDKGASDYVNEMKLYDEDSRYRFHCYDVETEAPEARDFDLLISLSSGLMAEVCAPCVASGGFLLVNDAHSDARTAFVNDSWELYAYWDDDANQFVSETVNQCFQVLQPRSKETIPISKEQAEESVKVGTVKKRSFKLAFEPMLFLFKRKQS